MPTSLHELFLDIYKISLSWNLLFHILAIIIKYFSDSDDIKPKILLKLTQKQYKTKRKPNLSLNITKKLKKSFKFFRDQ